MTRYTIRIDYQTGNSFGSYDETGELGLIWTDRDKAKAALARIKAFYEAEDDYRNRGKIDISTLPGYDAEYPQTAMTFELDDGTEHRHQTFWRGHFETLHRAEVIMVDDRENDGMLFEP